MKLRDMPENARQMVKVSLEETIKSILNNFTGLDKEERLELYDKIKEVIEKF